MAEDWPTPKDRALYDVGRAVEENAGPAVLQKRVNAALKLGIPAAVITSFALGIGALLGVQVNL